MSHGEWKHLNRGNLGLFNAISRNIHEFEFRNPGCIAAPSIGNSILIASDYGGEHSASPCRTYAFLVVDAPFTWLFLEGCKEIRKNILKQNRRMSYKNLNDKMRRDALMPFLYAADFLPGTLFVFCVDKNVQLVEDDCFSDVLPEFEKFKDWKPSTSVRFYQIALFAGMLLGGLSRPGQNVVWITDEDEFTANDARTTLSTKLFGHIASHFLSHDLGHLRFGSSRVTDHKRQSEDLVAVADLVAGMIADTYGEWRLWETGDWRSSPPIRDGDIKKKAHAILAWFAGTKDATLKRFLVRVTKGDTGGVLISIGEAHTERP